MDRATGEEAAHMVGDQRVVAVLVPERSPRDITWRELCDDLGVVLLSENEIGNAATLA